MQVCVSATVPKRRWRVGSHCACAPVPLQLQPAHFHCLARVLAESTQSCAQLSAQACPEVTLERLFLGFLLLLVMLVLAPLLIIFRRYATLKCEVKALPSS